MRVRFKNHIEVVNTIYKIGNANNIIVVCASGKEYTIECATPEIALDIYERAFFNGYLDVREYEHHKRR